MLSNLVTSLLLHEQVVTTLAKAKEVRPLAEQLITRAKRGRYREVRRRIHDKRVFQKLCDVLAPRYQSRPGGYTQIFRLAPRAGDQAQRGLVRLMR